MAVRGRGFAATCQPLMHW